MRSGRSRSGVTPLPMFRSVWVEVTHSLYAWIKRYAGPPGVAVKDNQPAEIGRLKQELARVTEERDILKKPLFLVHNIGDTPIGAHLAAMVKGWPRSFYSFLKCRLAI